MIKFSIRPLYLQVRDSLAERIALGDWKPNTAVPNEMELARELGVSPGTMRKALDLLESEGLVTRQQGRGTFINDLTSPALASRYSHFCSANGERVVGELKALDIYAGLASDAECERLQLTPQDHVYRITRFRSYTNKPFLFETVSLPMALFPGLTQRGLVSSALTTIANAYGLLLGNAVETVSPGAASASVSKALDIAESSPVLILDRLIMTRAGRPAEWRVGVCCRIGELHYKVKIRN